MTHPAVPAGPRGRRSRRVPALRAALAAACLAALGCGQVLAADEDDDALALEAKPAPAASASATASDARARWLGEAVLGHAERRGRDGTAVGRLSLDYNQSWRLTPQARFVLSDRLDLVRPRPEGGHTATNTLREAYVGWQAESGSWGMDVGRINLRHGPSYGFNPTDVFRRGAVRILTSPDPMALRENRQGTVMLRAQALWSDGAAAIALAPRLDDAPSGDSFDLDLGATNGSHRLLLTWSQRFSERFSTQALWLAERGQPPLLGASATWLVNDALVGFAEWTGGRRHDLLSVVQGAADSRRWRNQLATGGTLTLPGQWSVTLEYDHNGLAPDGRRWKEVTAVAPQWAGPYLQAALFNQDSVSREAWMLYATKKSLFVQQLDLTALVRRNQGDGSWFAWLELRRHWPRVDVALQWQYASGSALSEYGAIEQRQRVQLLAGWFF